jgi:hypothetical protein
MTSAFSWHARDLVRLEMWQHLLAKATDLVEEHFVRHRAPVHADQNSFGASLLGLGDDLFDNIIGSTRCRRLSTPDNIVNGEIPSPDAIVIRGVS